MISKFILNTAILLSVLTAYSQTDTGAKISTKVLKVNNNIYMLQGKGGNIGFSVGTDGVFMIDNQFAENIEAVKKDIKKITKEPIKFIVNTHFHEDHTGGNQALAESGTIIFSHKNTRDRLQNVINGETKKLSDAMLPVITFKEDLTFHINNDEILVFHTPNSHTDGDAMVYFKNNNVLHMGDVFFNGKYPYIDTKSGGNILSAINALEQAKKIINENTKIIPGHGPLGTYDDLSKTIDMLSILYKRVTVEYIKEKTLEEVMAMTKLTEQYDAEGYGDGFVKTEDFLKMLYNQVAEERSDIDALNAKNKAAMEKYKKLQEKKEKEKRG
ncbi:MAG: MBL fold metallo-hydrolase [Aequorivita sp.]|nr:MBL fold metallo-hydrolase [Aequorivita sp.]|tara:strand:+ start:18859 stop:19842 length:984 start_codon:yes stop_codon:yes gene_type:complete